MQIFPRDLGAQTRGPIFPVIICFMYGGILVRNREFHFHLRCSRVKLCHLIFVNDLVFSRGDLGSINVLRRCSRQFRHMSELIANPNKYEIYLGGVPPTDARDIVQHTGFSVGSFPFLYLKLPLSSKRFTHSQCQPLFDKIRQKLYSWTAKRLSYARRKGLIQSVLVGVITFWSSMFLLPKHSVCCFESLCSRFLWSGAIDTKKLWDGLNYVSSFSMVDWDLKKSWLRIRHSA